MQGSILSFLENHISAYKKAADFAKKAYWANFAFSQLCIVSRLFSDAERNEFEAKYLPLSQEYLSLNFIVKIIYRQYSETKHFLDIYFHLADKQSANNQCYADNLRKEEERKEQERLRQEQLAKEAAERERLRLAKIQADEVYNQFLENNPYIAISDWNYLKNQLREIYPNYEIDDKLINQRNKAFRETQKEQQKEYFDTLLAYPLDAQQREALVTLGENVLVTAAAGSGKTSTIVAKTHYLVNQLAVDPRNILVVTYTHKAAEELVTRVGVSGVECATFHSHAMDTIGMLTGRKPTICDPMTINIIFDELMKNPSYKADFFSYETVGKSILLYDYNYKTATEYFKALQENGKLAAYRDMDNRLCYMKSRQEMELMVILTEMGLQVRYEEAYPFSTATNYRRQYKPDFTIYYKQESNGVLVDKTIYLEHFGIDAQNRVPLWFGDGKNGGWVRANKEYNEGIAWKKELHNKHHTTLLYTTSADFQKGIDFVRNKVKNQLSTLGVPIRNLDENEQLSKLAIPLKRSQEALIKLVSAFITLMKANGKNIDNLVAEISESDPFRGRNIFVLQNLIAPLYKQYQERLNARNEMDFTDCLIRATELLNEKQIYSYQYILVDEFQDMSIDKYRYLAALRQEHPRTRIFCVGDDWQSIYRFSGSDICLFSKFEQYNGPTEECKIEATHRFGEPLLKRSSTFILKNGEQKPKKLIADKDRETFLAFAGYDDEKQERTIIERQVAKLPEKARIYLLSRYKYDIASVFPETTKKLADDNAASVTIDIAGRKIHALTVHSSKGLEADYVFLINCNSGYDDYGFPSQVSDDPIMQYVLSGADSYEHAEERRLFYVAITRAKRATYVLYDKQYPSLFVTEMGGNKTEKQTSTQMNCPRCRNGILMFRKDGFAKNGTFYTVASCTNKNCDYKDNFIFFDSTKATLNKQTWEEFLLRRNVTAAEKAHIAVGQCAECVDPVLIVPCAASRDKELHLSIDPHYENQDLLKFYQRHLINGDLAVIVQKQDNIERLLLSYKYKSSK